MKKAETLAIFGFVMWGTLVWSGCCGQEVHLYPGPKRNPSGLARLEVYYVDPGLRLEVDGAIAEWDPKKLYPNPACIFLLPGEHDLVWSRTGGDMHKYTNRGTLWEIHTISKWSYEGRGVLNAKAGKRYVFRFAALEGWRTREVKQWATWIEDIPFLGTGNTVVVGHRPEWTEKHDCEICGKKKAAAPCKYACFPCRTKRDD